jgi:integrase
MRTLNRLSAVRAAKLKKPGRYADGGGLYLQVSAWGTKAWLFRYMLDGRARQMGLGPLHTVSLADARERARSARVKLLDGADPIDAKREQRLALKAETAKLVRFREAADKYIGAHRSGWRNAKHAEQWEATLTTYAYPILGDLSVAMIDTAHVMKVLEPIWTTKTETASRVRGRIEAVLAWASARDFRPRGENPARWKNHLDQLLPAKTKVRPVQHQPAMPFANVPPFISELRAQDSISARALEFTILTAVRTGEAVGARWSELDLKTKTWTVPGDRTKSGREHRVPLSDRALEILRGLPRLDRALYVFPGQRAGHPLSNMALLELLRGMRPGLTVHGFRSSFRDWCGEATNYPRELAEAALAHIVADRTEAAYRRGDALLKRSKLMQAWANFCGTPRLDGKVIAIRK